MWGRSTHLSTGPCVSQGPGGSRRRRRRCGQTCWGPADDTSCARTSAGRCTAGRRTWRDTDRRCRVASRRRTDTRRHWSRRRWRRPTGRQSAPTGPTRRRAPTRPTCLSPSSCCGACSAGRRWRHRRSLPHAHAHVYLPCPPPSLRWVLSPLKLAHRCVPTGVLVWCSRLNENKNRHSLRSEDTIYARLLPTNARGARDSSLRWNQWSVRLWWRVVMSRYDTSRAGLCQTASRWRASIDSLPFHFMRPSS